MPQREMPPKFAGLTQYEKEDAIERQTQQELYMTEVRQRAENTNYVPSWDQENRTPEQKHIFHQLVKHTDDELYDYLPNLKDLATYYTLHLNDFERAKLDEDLKLPKYLDPKDREDTMRLKTGESPGSITKKTQLVALYNPTSSKGRFDEHARLLKNISGVANQCYIRGYLELPDGELYPKPVDGHCAFDDNGPNLFVTFRTLAYAPCVRLEIRFCDETCGMDNAPYHRLRADFHWANDSAHDERGVKDFKISRPSDKIVLSDKVYSFTSGYATVSGMNAALKKDFRVRCGPQGCRLVDAINSLCEPEAPQQLRLHLLETRPRRGKAEKKKNVLAKSAKDKGKEPQLDPDAYDEMKLYTIPELISLESLLPGEGLHKGYLLPSFSRLEYSMFRDHSNAPFIAVNNSYGRLHHVAHIVRHPMIPLLVEHTFASVEEAQIQFANHAHYTEMEQRLQRELFCKTSHQMFVYTVHDMAVAALRFGNFQKLASEANAEEFRLPEYSKITLTYRPRLGGLDRAYRLHGFVPGVPLGNFPAADALVITTNRAAHHFLEDAISLEQHGTGPTVHHTPALDVQVKIDSPEATYKAHMNAARLMGEKINKRWGELIKNQLHSRLPVVDISTKYIEQLPAEQQDAERQRAQAAFDRKFTRFPFNEEQQEALRLSRSARGGLVCIMGIAGTGKTTVAEAEVNYFYETGHHVLYLAPANSNVDSNARKLKTNTGIDVKRMYPEKVDLAKHQMLYEEKDFLPFPIDEESDEFVIEFQNIYREMIHNRSGKAKARDLGFQQAVLDDAISRKHIGTWFKQPTNRDGVPLGEPVDVWRELLQCIQLMAQDVDLNEVTLKKLKRSYAECLRYKIGTTRVVAATPLTAVSESMTSNFAQGKYGDECKGLVIVIDEAAKAEELQLWVPILHSTYSEKVVGVFLFGDEKQLRPINTSSSGSNQASEFRARGDISLPSRLVNESFPSMKYLWTQARMHPDVSAWPSEIFYDGKLKNAATTRKSLDEAVPGLKQALTTILQSTGRDGPFEERELRVHYLAVDGPRLVNPRTQSKVILEAAVFFFDTMWEPLHEVFGDRFERDVYVMTAYQESRGWWLGKLNEHRMKSGLSRSHYPDLVTVDGCQGNEAQMTITDGGWQQVNDYRDVGFMRDHGRFNAVVTRAKHVQWMIAGNCEGSMKEGTRRNPPIPVAYFNYATVNDQVSRTGMGNVPDELRPAHLVDLA